ncbi:MAG: hypothetical protein KC421_06510, partial [Anaerolineales bacterium]|nr:hypothetical protein [Anaerolineales bacterium]
KQSPISNLQSPISNLPSLIAAAQSGATLGQLWGIQPEPGIPAHNIPPFPRQRASQSFEKLREAADDYLAAHGHRPQIFLANIGPLSNHKPRADFTVGFFEVGGFEFVQSQGFERAADAAAAALASGVTAVAVCGTDTDYPNFVPPFVRQLKAQQSDTTVILAGYPKDHIESFQSAGVDLFIHIKADCLKINQTLQAKFIAEPDAKTEPDQNMSDPTESNLILGNDVDAIFG